MARLFVDNLTVMDFSFLDRNRGVVGESWIVDIELSGGLDEQGMVFDFGKIKKQIKQFIDTEVDHRLLVPVASTGCKTTLYDGQLSIEFPLEAGGIITHQSPQDAVFLVDAEVIETHVIINDLQEKLKAILPDNVTGIRINLRNEVIDGAYYHYSHGLQKHLGQCQRIAHGHRSRLEVQIDGERNSGIEKEWADRLRDIYIATECHIIEEFELNGITHTRMAYTAQQGDFAITLPTAQIFTITVESTVENLATCLAAAIAKENRVQVLVKAYEGLDKGAFGEAAG